MVPTRPLPLCPGLMHSAGMPHTDRTTSAQDRARRLRKEMTPSELSLWKELRGSRLGVRFRRQEPIGPYIVDFICRPERLVVEADGDHHESSGHDQRRDAFLRSKGYRVLRFWNEDVAKYPDWVLTQIREAIEVAAFPPG